VCGLAGWVKIGSSPTANRFDAVLSCAPCVRQVAKFAYLHYRVTACRNVLRWRLDSQAATRIQVRRPPARPVLCCLPGLCPSDSGSCL
jgi:hypothetical protein